MGVYDIFLMISRWIVPSILLVLVVFFISLFYYKFIYKKVLSGKKNFQFSLFPLQYIFLFYCHHIN